MNTNRKATGKFTSGKVHTATMSPSVMTTKKSMQLGGGARFKSLAKKVGSPALAAWIGRKKYGSAKFAKLSAKGRK